MDIAKRRADRLRVMKAIFDSSGGCEGVLVRTIPYLQDSLGLPEQELADACNYLVGEGLIVAAISVEEAPGPLAVRITHRGIKEMEQSLAAPGEPTQHFPPAVSIVNVHGSVIGSAIQSGSPGAHQDIHYGDLDLGAVREFLHQFDAAAAKLDLPAQAAEELAAEIDTVKAQLRSPKPKIHVLRESLVSARNILEIATGSAGAVGLLDILQHLHL